MTTIRVATYNVHGCKGTDRRVSEDRVLQVLHELDADCIALQEFIDHSRSGARGLLRRWSKALGMHGYYAPGFSRRGELFGTALLARWPLDDCRTIEYSVPPYRKRTLTEAILPHRGLHIRLISIHMGVIPRERHRQIDGLLNYMQDSPADVQIVLGDFNEWRGKGRVSRALAGHFEGSRPMATFPAYAPAFALDRVWVYPQALLHNETVHATPLSRTASDHLPLLVTVTLPTD